MITAHGNTTSSTSSTGSKRGRKAAAALLSVAVAGGVTAGLVGPAGSAQAAGSSHTTRAKVSDIHFGVRDLAASTAGHHYVELTFTNTASHPVTIYGFAGVSFVAGGNGTQVGQPASRVHVAPVTNLLQPRQVTTELVALDDPGAFGPTTGHTVTTDGFRVYLPEATAAVYVPFRTTASSRDVVQLHLDPVGVQG